MSQINDALKRAKQSQKPRMEETPVVPPLPPLPPVRSSAPGNSGWVFLVILLIAIACFFIGLAVAIHKPVTATNTVTVTNVVQVAAVAPVVKTPPPTNVTPPAPTPPPAPDLKLEGIFYDAAPPQAIVNGQTVYVGDTVNGFRVKTISKNNVSFVAPDGTEKTLALNQ
jgi:hypothetical protein